MIAIEVTEATKRLIAALNDGYCPEPELVATYFVVKESHQGHVPTFIDVQEFRDLYAKFDIGHQFVTLWQTV